MLSGPHARTFFDPPNLRDEKLVGFPTGRGIAVFKGVQNCTGQDSPQAGDIWGRPARGHIPLLKFGRWTIPHLAGIRRRTSNIRFNRKYAAPEVKLPGATQIILNHRPCLVETKRDGCPVPLPAQFVDPFLLVVLQAASLRFELQKQTVPARSGDG